MSEPTDRTDTLDQPLGEGGPGTDGAAPPPPRRRRSRRARIDDDGLAATDPALLLAPVQEPDGDTPPSPPLRPRVLSGRYLLARRIASGGMASVWQARDEVLARTVAVKLLHDHLAADDDFRERFRREAVSAAKLSHPSIVGLYDTGTDNGQVFLVMEFVDGPTLRDVIARSGGLDPGHGAAVGERVARALDYAHARGLVHRDVKPANILIGQDGAVKVADFGIAKADHADDLTKTGMVLGTAAYVAPEQILARPINGAADQYALGCVLYEALTGRQPFKAETAVATAAQRLERPPPPVRAVRPDVPRGLDEVIGRAMAREPRDRFPSAGHLADALAVFADADTARTAALVAPAVPRLTPLPGTGSAGGGPAGTVPQGPSDDGDRTWSGPAGSASPGSSAASAVTVTTPAPPAAPAAPPAPARAPRRRRTALWLVPLLVLLLGGAGVLGAVGTGLLQLSLPGRPAASEPPTAPETPQAEPDAPVPAPAPPTVAVPVTPRQLAVFDPAGTGARGENDELLPAVVDGDPDTAWRTEGYAVADLSRIKPGVGFTIDLGAQHPPVTSVVLGVATPGLELELRAAGSRPRAPGDARVVARVEDAGSRTVLEPATPVTERFLVVWITGGLEDDGSGSNPHRAAISSLEVRGAAT